MVATRNIPNDFVAVDVAWSPDGRSIATAVSDGWRYAVAVVDATTGAVQVIGGHKWDDMYSIAWPRDGSHLIVAALDYAAGDAVQIWDVALPAGTARRITKDVASYTAISLTADAGTIVAVRQDSRHSLWVAPSSDPSRLSRIKSVPDTVAAGVPPRWTVDGRILYTANEEGSGNYDVWTVLPDGGDLRQLTTAPDRDGFATMAPDGRFIAFLSNRDGLVRVWQMDSEGGRQTPVSSGPFDYYPVVTSDSRGVYFIRFDQPDYPLYMTPIEGGQATLLSGPTSMVPAGKWQGVPAVFLPDELSPDGSIILGSYNDPDQRRRRVALVPTDGRSAVRRLDIALPSGISSRSLAWAPDSRAITFVRMTEGAANLWRQPLDGGPATRVTNYPPGDDIARHAWSRDGKLLAMIRGTAERHVVMMREVPTRR